jgi:MoaA/NifB/PqqE/SkfB family radical SAM enzyme
MYFDIDSRFKEHFRNLKQVFLYITDECNLRCIHCLYKPNLIFHLKNKEIELNEALALISDFRDLGAIKLTLLGGEPTLYSASKGYEPLLTLIKEAKNLGYEYVRISTNGIFDGALLLKSTFRKIDEIAFSLDGPSSQINDPLRGMGTFDRCVSNIRKAVELGYKVSITCCIHRRLLQRNRNRELFLDLMIKFAESLGVEIINFHDLFKAGVPMDTWTGNFEPSIEEWLSVYKEIRKNIINGKYKIKIRLPLCFVTREEFEKNPEYYGYCPAKMGERVMVHPNGIIRICSNLICSPYGVARFYDRKIIWDESPTNELHDHNLTKFTPCTNRGKKDFGKFVPLCFSFKPSQGEIVWKRLNWESRKLKLMGGNK